MVNQLVPHEIGPPASVRDNQAVSADVIRGVIGKAECLRARHAGTKNRSRRMLDFADVARNEIQCLTPEYFGFGEAPHFIYTHAGCSAMQAKQLRGDDTDGFECSPRRYWSQENDKSSNDSFRSAHVLSLRIGQRSLRAAKCVRSVKPPADRTQPTTASSAETATASAQLPCSAGGSRHYHAALCATLVSMLYGPNFRWATV